MSKAQRALVVALAVAALLLIGWRAAAWRAAVAEHEHARAFHAEISGKTARLAALRAQPPISGFGARPADDVIQLANRVLESAGIPAARLRSVQSEADRALPEDRDGRRAATARLAVEPLTVQELGSLLAAWRNGQQVWSVSRIDLNAIMRGEGGTRSAGQYRASITVTATYIDDTTPAASPLLGAAQ